MLKTISAGIAMAAIPFVLALNTISAQAQDRGPITVVMGTLEDQFFSAVKAGSDQAAKDFGVEYTYIGANLSGPDLARALETAVSTNPAGIAFGNWFPDTENPIVKRASEQGIPLVAVNSTSPDWAEATGAMAFVGQSDHDAGVLGGQLLAKAGVKKGLCLNHAAGAQNLEQRCDGFKQAMEEAGAKTALLTLPFEDASNPTKLIQAVQGAIANDAEIDGVFTLGSSMAVNARRAIEESGKGDAIKVGSVDLSSALLDQIKDGKIIFTIDQQAYLQGYYAVAILAQNAKYGLHLVGQIKTGPTVIDKSNVEKVIDVNNQYPGVRGAF